MGPTKRGKGTKLMVMADAAGLPVAAHTSSASPAEVTLVQATLETRFVPARPERLIGDKAYDSDPLDAALAMQGVEMIAPHRRGRKKAQDPRRTNASSLPPSLESRTAQRLAAELSAHPHPPRT